MTCIYQRRVPWHVLRAPQLFGLAYVKEDILITEAIRSRQILLHPTQS